MYRKSVLDNGLRVVTHDMKERDSVGVGFWVGAGGRYEDDKIKGAAHFLEHILFKGTKNYSCDAIKEKIEGVGGALNAFTAEEQTCYYAKIPAKHIEKTFDILADMVFYPNIAKSDVEKEKGVIVEEIKMYHDLPQYYVLELLDGLMWPNHPLGKNLAGTAESVTNIQSKDLKDFHKKHYTVGNVVASACGNIEHQKFAKLVTKKLKSIVKKPTSLFLPAKGVQKNPKLKCHRKDIEQMHLALGMPGLEDDHADKYVQALLHVVLGGNMSSRLFDEVREKRGLAYSISSCVKSMKDTGMFMIRAGVDNQKVVDAVEVILKELNKIKRNGILQGEFNRAKDYYLGQVLLGLEDTLDHMLWIGEGIISRNQWRTLNDVVKAVNKVKKEDVQRLAKKIMREYCYNLSLVGPITDKQEQKLEQLLGL